jgi:hypothetical protein
MNLKCRKNTYLEDDDYFNNNESNSKKKYLFSHQRRCKTSEKKPHQQVSINNSITEQEKLLLNSFKCKCGKSRNLESSETEKDAASGSGSSMVNISNYFLFIFS